jgi:hypothetical protein
MAPNWPIPEIPGVLLEDNQTRHHLNQHVAQLCERNDSK